jgi:excisionase family DNA binding protein
MATMPHARAPLTRGDVLTAAEVAALLGCSKRHVYNLVDRDQLPGARRLGHRILIVRPVLEAWLLGEDDAGPSTPRA